MEPRSTYRMLSKLSQTAAVGINEGIMKEQSVRANRKDNRKGNKAKQASSQKVNGSQRKRKEENWKLAESSPERPKL